MLDCTLTYCGSNAEVLYAVLCTAAITTFAQTNDQRHFQGFVYFKDRALYHLQQAVDQVNQTAPGIPTVYAVSLLLYLEVWQPVVRYAVIRADNQVPLVRPRRSRRRQSTLVRSSKDAEVYREQYGRGATSNIHSDHIVCL